MKEAEKNLKQVTERNEEEFIADEQQPEAEEEKPPVDLRAAQEVVSE